MLAVFAAAPGVLLPVDAAAAVEGDAAASIAAWRRCSCVVRTPGCDGYFALSRMGRFTRVDVGVVNAGDDIDSTVAATIAHLPSCLTSRWRVVGISVVATLVPEEFVSLFKRHYLLR